MALLPKTGDPALRYAPYISELQEFFAVHGLRCGAPEDLTPLANRLGASGAFAAELVSMVRSVIFRERGSISQTDLLALLALAGGGPNIASHAHDAQPSLETIAGFLTSVTRAPVNQAPPHQPQPAEAEPAQLAPQPLPPEPLPLEPSALSPTQPRIDPPRIDPPIVEPATPPHPLPEPPVDKFLAAATLTATELRTGPVPILPPPRNRRPLWAAGTVALPLTLLAALLLRHHPSAATTPVRASSSAPIPASAPPASQSPLPSPQPTLTAAVTPPVAIPEPAPAPASPPTPLAASTPRPSAIAAVPSRPALRRTIGKTAPAASPKPPSTSTEAITQPASQPAATDGTQSSALAFAHPAESQPAIVPADLAPISGHPTSFDVSSGIMSSHLLSSSQPNYPELAKVAHVEGSVILQAVVTKTGKVAAVKVLSGHRLLRKAAANAVRDWRYRPYLADGRAVDVATIITLDFKLPN